MIVFIYRKNKNIIEKVISDGFENNAFVTYAPRGYEKEYCYLEDGDEWSEDLESLMNDYGSFTEEQKERYREEWL